MQDFTFDASHDADLAESQTPFNGAVCIPFAYAASLLPSPLPAYEGESCIDLCPIANGNAFVMFYREHDAQAAWGFIAIADAIAAMESQRTDASEISAYQTATIQ